MLITACTISSTHDHEMSTHVLYIILQCVFCSVIIIMLCFNPRQTYVTVFTSFPEEGTNLLAVSLLMELDQWFPPLPA